MSRPTGDWESGRSVIAMCTRPGESLRVSYGVRKTLPHSRDGHENPAVLATGERYRVRIQLNDMGLGISTRAHKVRLCDIDGLLGRWSGPVADGDAADLWPAPSILPQRPPNVARRRTLAFFPNRRTALAREANEASVAMIWHIERIDRIGLELGQPPRQDGVNRVE